MTAWTDDPILRRLVAELATNAADVSDAVRRVLEHIDRTRRFEESEARSQEAIALADAALGAGGRAVRNTVVREVGKRVADGRMTGEEAATIIRALTTADSASANPSAAILDERVGPFYDTAGVLALLGIDCEALEVLVADRDVLVVDSADHFHLFPSFQFDEQAQLIPRLRDILASLDPAGDDLWGDAVWLNSPDQDLGGLSPAASLRTGRHDTVLRLAEQASAFRLG
ncbi:hypothetical protein [Curtobacterium sp. ME26]|uniref:hypothetical protein n=1 Tax=Curtobacterium sp. ME26 TaxID=2744254 RepID=UPI0015F50298|nr:hypothetical protein [Curtobacterium sp. ME26]